MAAKGLARWALTGLAALVLAAGSGCEIDLEDISIIVERDRSSGDRGRYDGGWFGFDIFVEDDCCRDEYYYEEQYYYEEWWP